MSLTYGFYNSQNHDRMYDAIQLSQLFDGLIADGVYQNIGNNFMVSTLGEDYQVTVDTGRGWFHHTWNYNDAKLVITMPTPPTYGTRWDMIVLDINGAINVRENVFTVVSGKPTTGTPTRPTLIDDDDNLHWQIPIAEVLRQKLEDENGNIRQQYITQLVGTTTPFVNGLIRQYNIAQLVSGWADAWNTWSSSFESAADLWKNNQEAAFDAWTALKRQEYQDFIDNQEETVYQWERDHEAAFLNWSNQQKDAFASWMAGRKTDFDTWFANIRYVLDGDVAGHLQNEIDDINWLLDPLPRDHGGTGNKYGYIRSGDSEINHNYDVDKCYTVEGTNNKIGDNPYGIGWHIEGVTNNVSGKAHDWGLHIEGFGNDVYQNGFTSESYKASHAEGYLTKIMGDAAHVEGENTYAWKRSHSEGGKEDVYNEPQIINVAPHITSSGYATMINSDLEDYMVEVRTENPEYEDKVYTYFYKKEWYFNVTNYKMNWKFNAKFGNDISRSYIEFTNGVPWLYYTNTSNYNIKYKVYPIRIPGFNMAYCISGHVEGTATTIFDGNYSHAEGNKTTITDAAIAAHAEGYHNTTRGKYSHIEGNNNHIFNEGAHVEGKDNVAKGDYSHIEGLSNTTSAAYTHAEGYGVIAATNYAHAEGQETTASGTASHAEGKSTTAYGEYAHAEGNNSRAIGDYSHVEGSGSKAIGIDSHAGGGAIANLDHQFVHGIFGFGGETKEVFPIPNGNHTGDANGDDISLPSDMKFFNGGSYSYASYASETFNLDIQLLAKENGSWNPGHTNHVWLLILHDFYTSSSQTQNHLYAAFLMSMYNYNNSSPRLYIKIEQISNSEESAPIYALAGDVGSTLMNEGYIRIEKRRMSLTDASFAAQIIRIM